MNTHSERPPYPPHTACSLWDPCRFFFNNVNLLPYEEFRIFCQLAFQKLTTDNAKVEYIIDHLSGAPLVIAWGFVEPESAIGEKNDYKCDPIALLSKLDLFYGDYVSPEQALMKLHNHKQNGIPVLEYTREFHRLVKRVNKTYLPDELCEMYIRGLDGPLEVWVRSLHPNYTLDEAFETANKCYNILGCASLPNMPPAAPLLPARDPTLTSFSTTFPFKYSSSSFNNQNNTSPDIAFYQQSVSSTLAQQLNRTNELLAKLIQAIKDSRQSHRSYKNNRSKRHAPTCYRCGVVGHTYKQCPHPPISTTRYLNYRSSKT